MAKQTRKKSAVSPPARKKTSKKALTSEELTQKHLSDPNHKLTDDELKNVRTDLHVATDEPELPKGDERPHDVDKDHHFKTPWDVLKNT